MSLCTNKRHRHCLRHSHRHSHCHSYFPYSPPFEGEEFLNRSYCGEELINKTNWD